MKKEENMKVLLLTLIVALQLMLTSCTPCWNSEDFAMPSLQITPAEKEIDDGIPVVHCEEMTSVVQEVTVALKYDKRLILEDSKTFFNDGIHTLQLQFRSQALHDMCDARMLIVDVVELLLAKLNQDIILGPDFANYPFRPENLEIYITFESFFGRYVDPYYISWIGLEDGMVTFYTFSLKDNVKNCWCSRREAYATSREIVVYERQAEDIYKDNHPSHTHVFGEHRFFQEP